MSMENSGCKMKAKDDRGNIFTRIIIRKSTFNILTANKRIHNLSLIC